MPWLGYLPGTSRYLQSVCLHYIYIHIYIMQFICTTMWQIKVLQSLCSHGTCTLRLWHDSVPACHGPAVVTFFWVQWLWLWVEPALLMSLGQRPHFEEQVESKPLKNKVKKIMCDLVSIKHFFMVNIGYHSCSCCQQLLIPDSHLHVKTIQNPYSCVHGDTQTPPKVISLLGRIGRIGG